MTILVTWWHKHLGGCRFAGCVVTKRGSSFLLPPVLYGKSDFDAKRFLTIPFGPNLATVFGRDVGAIDDFLVIIQVVHEVFLIWTEPLP